MFKKESSEIQGSPHPQTQDWILRFAPPPFSFPQAKELPTVLSVGSEHLPSGFCLAGLLQIDSWVPPPETLTRVM